jgi:hypothetical protein
MRLFFKENRTLLVSIFVTLGAFVIGMLSLYLLWGGILNNPVDETFWGFVEAVSTAFAGAAVLGAGYLAFKELNEAAVGRYIDVADRLFQELNSVENIQARRWVYLNVQGEPEEMLSTLGDEGRDRIKTVLNSLDRLSFLTQEGWIDDDLIMPWMNPMVVKVWQKLGPFVAFERERRNEQDYYEHAERLARRCEEWRRDQIGDDETIWLKDAM